MKSKYNSPTKNPLATKAADEMVEEYPDVPSRTLGRMLYSKYPLVWATEASAYNAVRYRRGGGKGTPVTGRHLGKLTTPKDNPYLLPKSDVKEFKPYVIEITCRRECLILNDLHIPYHSISAITAAIDHGLAHNVDLIILNGDILDCHLLSQFDHDPGARQFADLCDLEGKVIRKGEVTMCYEFLKKLRELFPNAEIIFKEGNHDYRYSSFLTRKAPELFYLPGVKLPELLRLKELDIAWVADKRVIQLGHLPIIHGHEYRESIMAPVNAARGLYMKAKHSCACGHLHQKSEHGEITIMDKIIRTFSMGCLCDLHPKYMPLNRWTQGFARVEVEITGEYQFHNYEVINGKVFG